MRKLKTLLGIALTLVLLASLTVGLSAPAGADPGTLKFSTLTLPKVGEAGDYWAYPDSDVGAIDVAADGETLFAAVVKDSEWKLMKSSDGGYSWKVLEGFRDEAGDDTSDIVDVVVSPDYEDDLTVFVATQDFLYQSVDGGKRFVQMTTDWADTETITDLDVALDERGRLAIMVGTSSAVLVDLETTGDGTAWWSTEEPYSGSSSALLTTVVTGDASNTAQVKVAVSGVTIADVKTYDKTTINFMAYPGVQANGADIIMRLFVTKGDGSTYILENPGILATDGSDISTHTGAWEEYTGCSNLTWCGWNAAHDSYDCRVIASLTDLAWVDNADVVTHIAVCASGYYVSEELYVDDITLGATTYDLEAGEVYVLSTATGMSWQAQGIGDYDVLAVGFSPFFADDEGISAVVTDSTATKVRFSFAYVGWENPEDGWGADIGDATVKDAEGVNFPSSHASIAFPDDFDAFGVGNNICFVGIYAGSETVPDDMLGDVYKIKLTSASSATDLDIRGVITTLLPTQTNIVSIDVCGDAEEANILVGTDYCDLTTPGYYFLVYRSDDGGETWIPSGTKSPTGGSDGYVVFENAWTQVLMSPDFLNDDIAYAATYGEGTSALSRSKDGAATWDQIGLIDYGLMDVESETGKVGYVVADLDAAGYNAEGTLHMTTQTPVGYDSEKEVYEVYYGAIWKTDGKNWERIWSYANPAVTNDISELIINGDETMFAVDYAAEKIWRSSNMGATWPKTINTKPDLSAVTVVSPTTIYTGHTDGNIYWSTKSGTGWTKPDDSEISSSTVVANIGVEGDVVLVGTCNGMVFISSDGGETVERVGLTNPGDTDEIALATYDLGFADNNIIYAAVLEEDGGIWRTEVDFDDPGSSDWLRIDALQSSDPYDYNKVIPAGPALSLPPNGVLYVVNAEAVADEDADLEGGLWRCANPTDPAPYPYFEKENKGLDAGDSVGYKTVDLFPFVQFCSVINKTTTVPYYNQIVMFTDTLDSGVPLAAPADGAAGVGTLYTGEHEVDVVLVWEKMEGATKYQWQVAIDKDFDSVVGGGFANGNVAPYTASPDSTYYWRVRVAYEATDGGGDIIGAPLISPWSEKWSFKTAIGPSVARPGLEAPEAGFTDIALSPTFEWSGIAWAETYEFELGTDPVTTAGGYFATPLVSLTGANALVSTAWKCDKALEYETRYYWHVKAIGVDTETPWSDVGTFVTMAKPVPPVEPTPPVVVPPVEEITPAWIWAIIGIGAVLVISVIVLIVTTRRVP